MYIINLTNTRGAWPGLRQWRSLESLAPEGPAREPRPSAPAQAAGALNHPAALPESERSGGTPGSSPANIAAHAGLPRRRRELRPHLPPPKPRPRVSSGRSCLEKTEKSPEPRVLEAGHSDTVGAPLDLLVPPVKGRLAQNE
ncbi:hypothetical protein NDU88_004854 [Pleurodeles waltl]|uniref:Uncharacterized protein n=1 Tax=Pleurodeles waltl TaxID=8319 RepID=A0AAV7VL44_PLEWA|nr:hypothetical protein NDU88_004854 [Pleurodeles waltl]